MLVSGKIFAKSNPFAAPLPKMNEGGFCLDKILLLPH